MKNRVESIKAKLRNISKTSNKNHQLTLTRYFQERLLYRLSKSVYKDHFFLKGGVLIYALEGEASRPTLDLDLLARKIAADGDLIKNIFQEVCSLDYEEDGVNLEAGSIETSIIAKEGNYSGVRVKVRVSLGNIKQRLQIDLGFGDVIVPGPIKMMYPTLIEMDQPEVWAYSTESLIAEKFEAMIDLAELNSRMKDFYDVYRILSRANYNLQSLEEAITRTIQRRGTPLSDNHPIFKKSFHQDERRLLQWAAFLRKADLDASLPFSEVMKIIKEKLEPIYKRVQEQD